MRPSSTYQFPYLPLPLREGIKGRGGFLWDTRGAHRKKSHGKTVLTSEVSWLTNEVNAVICRAKGKPASKFKSFKGGGA